MRPADLAAELARRGARTLLVDGRSGSGKTTLAAVIAAAWPGAAVLRLDDVYPGWDGLDRASDHLVEAVLGPRARHAPAAWRAWDWTRDQPGAWHDVPDERPLVVDGVGSLTAAARALADSGVWVEAPPALRRSRALARDGDAYRPHWERWAAQEEAFIARCAPRQHADLVAVPTAGGFRLSGAAPRGRSGCRPADRPARGR